MTQLPEILTVADVQEYLRIGKRHACDRWKDPDFPAVRIGNSIGIPRKAFLEWLAIDEEDPVPPQNLQVELEGVVMTKGDVQELGITTVFKALKLCESPANSSGDMK